MRYDSWAACPEAGGRPLAAAILENRGIACAENFIPAPLKDLHDPFLLADMDKAVRRIRTAIDSGERIAVCGDYDVDGVTSCALLISYLRVFERHEACLYHIPSRLEQGYGLHADTLESMRAGGVTLVITVDVGVTAFEAASRAAEIGLDLVITDHHTCRDTLPPVCAVVNPKRPDSVYPFDGLAGVGVAFKLACALAGSERTGELAARFGDLVALGTIADIMPLTGENRILAKRGLETLSTCPRPGLRHLMDCVGLSAGRPVTASAVSFFLAPAINAAGRMADAAAAVELMLATDGAAAVRLAHRLFEMNLKRRELEADLFKQISERWEAENGSQPAIVMCGEGWHPGVTGIVCSRLLEKYKKPVFLIACENGIGKGSARSPQNVSLAELLATCSHTLMEFGGHAAAAGFKIDTGRVDEFRSCVFQNLESQSAPAPSSRELHTDLSVRGVDLTLPNAEAIYRLGPFGTGNEEPVLLLCGALLISIKPLKQGRHLKLFAEADGVRLPVLCFGFPADGFPFVPGDLIDIAFALGLNFYRGEKSVQLELRDIRPAERR